MAIGKRLGACYDCCAWSIPERELLACFHAPTRLTHRFRSIFRSKNEVQSVLRNDLAPPHCLSPSPVRLIRAPGQWIRKVVPFRSLYWRRPCLRSLSGGSKNTTRFTSPEDAKTLFPPKSAIIGMPSIERHKGRLHLSRSSSPSSLPFVYLPLDSLLHLQFFCLVQTCPLPSLRRCHGPVRMLEGTRFPSKSMGQ